MCKRKIYGINKKYLLDVTGRQHTLVELLSAAKKQRKTFTLNDHRKKPFKERSSDARSPLIMLAFDWDIAFFGVSLF